MQAIPSQAHASLIIEKCQIQPKKAAQLLSSLPNHLRVLNLRDSALADDAVFSLPLLLEGPTKLQALNLRGNNLRVEGAMSLA